MTSDRGNSGGAELTLTTPNREKSQSNSTITQVTPKTAGLNPNATVFSLSNKTTNTRAEPSQWDGVNANEYQYANGDVVQGEQGGAETLPESPLSNDVSPSYLDNQIQPESTTFPPENSVVDGEDNVVLSTAVTDDQLRQLLKEQLENCFSRENLASDRYLQSQMDADQYVPIATVANLQQIQQLTNDLDLIVELLKESANVQVDGKGEKVRPNHNRCIVILREIPESTPVEDVCDLFSGENCPKFVSCEFAANNSWYVTFDSDASAQQAYQYLREEVCTFLGKPVLARIKAKPLIRMTYPRNGYRSNYNQQQAAQQQQQQQQQQTVGVTSPPAVPVSQGSDQAQVVTQQQSQQQNQQQYQVQQQVPLMTQYINGQQTLPFFPNAALLQSWPANVNVTSPTLLDPSMVLAINGYQATSVKINPGPRHTYTNVNRNSSRNQRPLRLSQEQHRMHTENRLSQDRQQAPAGGTMDRRSDNPGSGGNSHRTSPRNSDNSQISGHHSSFHREGRRGDNPSVNHSHMVHSTVQQAQQQQPVLDNNSNIAVSNRQSDNLSQRPRSYRSRRRRDDDSARNMRLNSSQAITKDSKSPIEPQFDLEINSFPPLPGPGSANSSTAGEVFESKLSDVVKGTAKLQVKETKASPPPVPPPPPPPSVQSPPVAMVAPQPHIPTATTSVPAPTRPSTPPKSRESMSSGTGGSSGNTSTVPSGGSSTSSSNSLAAIATRVPSPPITPQKSVKTSNITDSQPKSSESHASQRQTTTVTKTVEKPVPSPAHAQSQTKLTYAQMLARGREAEAAAAEAGNKVRSSDDSGDDSSCKQNSPSNVRTSQTLKEQSQTIKQTSTANSRPLNKEQGRRDFEPKDQRFGSARRAKENRERRDRDRRRSERDGSRSATK